MLGDAHEIGAALHMEGLLIDVVGLGHLTSVGSENGDVAAIGLLTVTVPRPVITLSRPWVSSSTPSVMPASLLKVDSPSS